MGSAYVNPGRLVMHVPICSQWSRVRVTCQFQEKIYRLKYCCVYTGLFIIIGVGLSGENNSSVDPYYGTLECTGALFAWLACVFLLLSLFCGGGGGGGSKTTPTTAWNLHIDVGLSYYSRSNRVTTSTPIALSAVTPNRAFCFGCPRRAARSVMRGRWPSACVFGCGMDV